MLTVLIPYRAPRGSHRAQLAAYTAELWTRVPDVKVLHASDRQPGQPPARASTPFNYARGANRARAAAGAGASSILLYGADHIPPTVEEMERIRAGLELHPWLAVYDSVREYSPATTERILAGRLEPGPEPDGKRVKVCVPILAMRVDVFDDLGGMDERFRGWGYEDAAFRYALRMLHPAGNDVGRGPIRALWHPRASRRGLPDNLARYVAYEAAGAAGPAALRAHMAGGRPVL